MANGTQTRGEQKRKPIEVIRRYVGGATIDVALFEKRIEKKRGNSTFSLSTYFVAVSKSWKKKQDEGAQGPAEYDSGSVFNPHELLELADAIKAAHKRCLELNAGRDPSDDEEIPY
ncbi:MAG: hypothetical protein QM775_25665 [Pirellulales bacterium]